VSDINLDGMELAPGVVETIVAVAVKEVEGVAFIGSPKVGGFRGLFRKKPQTQGIEISITDADKLHVGIRINVYYGYVLPQVASSLRSSVADAIISQVGIAVESVDVYIDGLQFVE
jgi:uncharacterized alkaline shock family protein YloU